MIEVVELGNEKGVESWDLMFFPSFSPIVAK